ncbi:MAG: DNA-directed RNA polymerase subunit beta [Clostridia bacterium]|nr:DNA-directed RNA polymerase subunit beta [Clostridia bacterium]
MTNLLEGLSKVKFGNVERYSFARVKKVLPSTDLLELPKNSYQKFLDEGIGECLAEFSPIDDYTGKARVYFLDYHVDKEPKISKQECKRTSQTYSVPLKAKVRLVLTETGEAREQEVFLGDIPLMTEEGSFIFNGVERVVVNQIVRSPSVYFTGEIDKTGKELFSGQVIPTRGNWLEFEQSSADTLKIVIDRGSKISLVTFMKCFGYSNKEILDIFGDNRIVVANLEKEEMKTQEECLIELARKMRPNDIPDANATRKYINDIFFTHQYYNLARVGRYKFNKKLSLAYRIKNLISANDIKIKSKVIVSAGEVITEEMAYKIQHSGINVVDVVVNGVKLRQMGNNHVFAHEIIGCKADDLNLTELVYYPALQELIKDCKTKEQMIGAVNENVDKLVINDILVMEDILASISYHLGLDAGIGEKDNIDNLENRRVAPAGELLQNAFRSGVNKLATVVRETMQSQDMENLMPSTVMNARPINKELRNFIATSQLSQVMDQVNPISGLTQKRKLSSVGPGGIKKERAGAEVRDIHYTQYGRVCAIETPEGQNIGLINSFACYSRVNEYGFIECPYRKIDKETGVVTDEVVFMSAEDEKDFYLAQAVEPLDENGKLKNKRVVCRFRDEVVEVDASKVDYLDLAANQTLSAATSLIPFIENNEAARALMGSNMQRQAVPLIKTESPIVGTGMEYQIAVDSGAMIVARNDGIVDYVDANQIRVLRPTGEIDVYELVKFAKSNNETCYNQKPIINTGDSVKAGDVLADGYSTDNGELALGRNMLVAFLNFDGYNYEDAVVVSERISKEDLYTSINLRVEEIKCRSTKLGDEEITRDIPNIGEDALKNLDERGIIRVGAEVDTGDILVGKVTPKGEMELTPEERLLRAIFSEKVREVRDTSLRVQHGHGGVVVHVETFSRKNKDELESGVNEQVRVFIAQKRKLTVGDKVAGRYGNKGVVSRIVPVEDMPFMANGQPVDMLLNPLSVTSRMNLGQLLETHLGLVAKSLGWKICSPCFDGAKDDQVQQLLKDNNFPEDGKMVLYDGRTGLPYENKVAVGYQYMIKLDHMVDSKMHARSTGPYALITQQPLGGKAMFGGQRFGEMEVWALYAYGAAHILQEMVTVKSDDVAGRQKTYSAIVEGNPIAEPGIPESFKVLVKEFQALGLDVKILNHDDKEISLTQLSADEQDNINNIKVVDEATEIIDLNLDDTDLSLNGGVVPSEEDLAFNFDESMFDIDE